MTQAVFLDRDGVINSYEKHVNKPDDLYLYGGVGPAIRRLNESGYMVFIVTNQGGVGLGFLTEENLAEIHEHLESELKKDGAAIDEITACTHKPKAGCGCRKPEAGMILELAEKYEVDLAESYMVGDRKTDIDAGKKAGTKTIFIGNEISTADYKASNLPKAIDWILQQYK
ncbi:HAD family hydrolase [Alkalihalobacillus sp. AL-G]|uniref:D-glycero-alpha-D-manno-heptose-1,7-bisphosphate 7-phosphatase n=1 Tax=Alkalihalobacillus sp. AL-G TaxID=2926399 RepID=UPI00272B7548|nr:HAD family hydrolase [Alkalihalobacillus sp. AL-G]WLD91545.1 HAD family hydrolase [Alkalihalobacillus sp. AL-G]